MANKKVGTKTGEKTTAGKDVYKTPEGESVSEKSVTIKFGENAYVNAPSIHDGVEYSEDEIKQMLMDGKIKPTSRHDTLEKALEAAQERSNTLMNEGGMAIEKQTEPLFSKLFRPEVNLSGETTSKNIDFGELDNEPLKAELKQKNLSGRVGFTGTTENNTSYGLGANLSSNKGTIKTPKELREYGVPEKIEFGNGKLKGNSYDGFLALQDIFGVEGLEARIDAGYTPLEYEKDLKNIALNFKYKFNEGGMAIEKQMELFEDGGLMQEGGTVDPVSGNDVPVGSTQEEVRDDIPAQLSEGEFVFPADVVRFYGLEKLMEMRQRAKAGLKMMENMGQMGNSEEATLPDDIPFDLEDLDIEDEMGDNNKLEMQVGGFVQPQGFTGIQSTQPSQFQNYQPQYAPYQAPTPAQVIAPQYTPATQQVVPTMQQQQLPQFEGFISTPTGAYDELREYKNATTGEVRQIPFVGGNPLYPIPEGFEYVDPEKVTTTPTTVETAKVVEQQKDGGRDDSTTPSGATIAFGGSINNKGTVSGNYMADISFTGGSLVDVLKGTSIPVNMINLGKQLFSKNNLTPKIPTGMSAIMKNVQLPKQSGSIAPAETIAAQVQVDSDFYNKNIANTNVTDRTAISKTLGWIQDNYSKDFLNNPNNIINAELAYKTMEKEEKEQETASEVKRAQSLTGKARDLAFGNQTDNVNPATGFTKGSIIDKAIQAANQMVQTEESKPAAYEGGQGGGQDRSRDDVSPGGVGVDSSGFSTGAGGYGGYD